jgi:hypothetical protein
VRRSLRYFAATLLLVAGCATDHARIDTATTTCCSSPQYKTFFVKAESIPAFLGPLMVSNFSVAFANIGMQPVEEDADLNVVLRYEQQDLDRARRPRDNFEGKISSGDTTRFMARIVVEMHDAKTGKIVWSGHIQRLHDVGPGDYMHTGKASMAIFDAFVKLLKNYPG